MTTTPKASLDDMAGGLFMMTIFTAVWIGLAEYNLRGRDYWVVGVVFLAILLVFVSHYFKFVGVSKALPGVLPELKSAEEKKKDKWFMIIFGLEGLAIFLSANALINSNHFNYFVPVVALIVGLHFFPLGYLYKRKFDHYMGVWTCIIAVTGILLTYWQLPVFAVIGIVGIGCAIATAAQGIRMIAQGRKAMSQIIIG
jgi:MFS family permease